MAIIYQDTFTAADATQLINHTSDSGHTYTGPTDLAIYQNALFKSTNTNDEQIGFVSGITTSNDYILRATWLVNSGAASTDILFGGPDVSNCYMLRYRDDLFTLFSRTAGAFTSLGTYASASGVGSTTEVITINVTGDNIVIDKGVTTGIISVTDATHTKSGAIGFRAQGAQQTVSGKALSSIEYDSTAVATLTTTLVSDVNDTALSAPVDVDIAVFTTANVLVGTGTINVGTDGAVSISNSTLTLASGQNISDGVTYRVDFQESTGDRQRSVDLVAAV